MKTTADMRKLSREAQALYELYNVFGRGKIEEEAFCFKCMTGRIGVWIKDTYTDHEIAERLKSMGILRGEEHE